MEQITQSSHVQNQAYIFKNKKLKSEKHLFIVLPKMLFSKIV